MLTLDPARVWGFADRGQLAVGMAADVNVFDAGTVGPAVPELLRDLPGGGARLSQRAEGFVATIVAGEVTIEDGEPTGARPGRLLRQGRAERGPRPKRETRT